MLTLDLIKTHLHVDGDDENELIMQYMKASLMVIAQHTGRKWYDTTIPKEDTTGKIVTPDIEMAMLLLIGHWYANRETVQTTTGGIGTELPFSVWSLIQPYRVYKL